MKPSEASICLEIQLEELGLWFIREWQFTLNRRWRFDYCISDEKAYAAVEIEGGVWVSGRHNRSMGFIRDMEKYNEAALLGYSVLRFTPDQVKKGESKLILQRWKDRHKEPTTNERMREIGKLFNGKPRVIGTSEVRG